VCERETTSLCVSLSVRRARQCPEVRTWIHKFTRFICAFGEWKRQGMLSRVHAPLRLSKHIMRWELRFPHTNRHQNKQAPQLAYTCRAALSSTCELLTEDPVHTLLPLLCLTSKLLSCGPPHYRQKKCSGLPSRGTGSIPAPHLYELS